MQHKSHSIVRDGRYFGGKAACRKVLKFSLVEFAGDDDDLHCVAQQRSHGFAFGGVCRLEMSQRVDAVEHVHRGFEDGPIALVDHQAQGAGGRSVEYFAFFVFGGAATHKQSQKQAR